MKTGGSGSRRILELQDGAMARITGLSDFRTDNMSKIPSRKFPKQTKKIASKKFVKRTAKIPSRKFPQASERVSVSPWDRPPGHSAP